MVIKVYISGVSASQEVKKRQQRALVLLDSAQVNYEIVDITEPGRDEDRQLVQQTCKERSNPLPPQFFNDDLYCGDYDDFNSAVDVNKIFAFLMLDTVMEEISSYGENNSQEKLDVEMQNGKNENGTMMGENEGNFKRLDNEENETQLTEKKMPNGDEQEELVNEERKLSNAKEIVQETEHEDRDENQEVLVGVNTAEVARQELVGGEVVEEEEEEDAN